jgi:hypothetical protein
MTQRATRLHKVTMVDKFDIVTKHFNVYLPSMLNESLEAMFAPASPVAVAGDYCAVNPECMCN